MAERTRACTHCHGPQGQAGPDGYYPRLAGKPANYLYGQLLHFRDGRRHYPLMRGLLEPLSDTYLMEMAVYFSRLDLPYPPATRSPIDGATAARGRDLVLRGDPQRELAACASCHGERLTGTLPGVPGLLGLPRDYITAQLGAWKSGMRRAHEPDCMADVARRLNAADVNAIAHWLSSQPVPRSGPSPISAAANRTCGRPAAPDTEVKAPPALASLSNAADRGAYLARAGNCMSCHTTAGGAAYAGGRAIDTPFGTLWSGNLTPDRETGLGKWTPDDFWRAMHQGRSRDGRALYPAFPYPYFTRISRQDSDDLFAYLQTLTPVSKAQRPHDIRWPYGSPVALTVWRWLYFREGTEATGPNQDPRWLRGAYLVQGLSHCGACHTPRNRWGASLDALDLDGAVMPDRKWFAPSLRPGGQGGLGDRSTRDIVALLRSGVSDRGGAQGPMARVIQHGTQHLDIRDLEAMAVYLQSLRPGQEAETALGAKADALRGNSLTAGTGQGRRDGAALYDRHCAACHGEAGQGRPGVYPPLAGNRTVQQDPINNLIQIVLNGGYGPTTLGNPRPHGMPPFVLQLDDADLAALLSHLRSAWGHRAAPVTELQVQQARKTP